MTTTINTCTTTRVRVIPMLVLLLNLFLLIDVTSFSFVKASTSSSSTSSSGSIGSGIGLNIDISSPKYERVLNIRHGGSVNLESPSSTIGVSSASASGNNNGTTSSTAYEYILPEEATSAPSGVDMNVDVDADVVGASKGAGVNISSPVLGGEAELEFTEQQVTKKQKLKVLFLSADTGGGHRASAQSLGSQLLKHYPDTEFELADLWTPTNVYPYKTLVKSYKHLSAHPRQWRLLYYLSNTKWYEKITDVHSSITCYDKIEKHIESLDPDIVISVHPTMNYVPEKAVRNIGQKKGKYIPFFTVVTDFGSGHCTWFQGRTVDMIYVASQRIMKLAKRRGKFDHDKLVMSGLPIREDFAVQAKAMGDRTSLGGKGYRQVMKSKLGLDPHKKTVLVMGGGEGVGSLGQIAEKLREKLANSGVDATILVVCGRNEKLKDDLNGRDWGAEPMAVGRMKKRAKLRQLAKRILRKKVGLEEKASSEIGNSGKGEVDVIGLGFITNMAEFMVAADVLVSKAGPGTIAEAASLGLPVMITSFLPGQEAGNVDIVLDGGFGAFKKKPHQIADVVTSWMGDEDKLDEMSRRSSEVGNPQAASEIMEDIVRISLEKINKFES